MALLERAGTVRKVKLYRKEARQTTSWRTTQRVAQVSHALLVTVTVAVRCAGPRCLGPTWSATAGLLLGLLELLELLSGQDRLCFGHVLRTNLARLIAPLFSSQVRILAQFPEFTGLLFQNRLELGLLLIGELELFSHVLKLTLATLRDVLASSRWSLIGASLIIVVLAASHRGQHYQCAERECGHYTNFC